MNICIYVWYQNIKYFLINSFFFSTIQFSSFIKYPEINNTILIMIRKVIGTLFKPNAAFQNAYNKQFFAEPSKQTKPSGASQQNNLNTETKQQTQQQKTHHTNKQDENQNEEDFAYQKQNRNTVGWWIYRAFFWGTTFTLGYNIYLVANHDKKTPVQDEPTAIPYFIGLAKWMNNQYHEKLKFFVEPPVKKFLPDAIHPSMQAKTLVLNLSGTILKTDFVFGKGMTLKRRPGLDKFLKRLSQKYQVVIFSDDDYMFLTSAVQYLDPRQQIFMGAFGKESMVWSNGRYIKDLSYLNRDPRGVIIIDKDIRNIGKHPQNAIILKQFNGEESDDQLNKLLPLLQNLSEPGVKDVRKVLAKLGDNPHQAFYQKFQQKKKKIEKKQSGMFGFLGGAASHNAKN